MIDNAYQTKSTSIYQIEKIANELSTLTCADVHYNFLNVTVKDIMDDFKDVDLKADRILPILPIREHEYIEPFQHPILLPQRSGSKNVVAVDLRTCLRENTQVGGQLKVTDMTTLVLMLYRAYLEALWQEESIRNRLAWNLPSVVSRVYTGWVAGTIQRERQLTPPEAMTVRIVTEAFFLDAHFKDSIDVDDRAARVSRNVRTTAADVKAKLASHDHIKDLDDYLDACKDITDSLRMTSVDTSLIGQILNNAWYGTQFRQLSVGAVEYPPNLLAMLMTIASVGESWLMRSSGLGRVIKSIGPQAEKDLKRLAMDVGRICE